MPISLYLAHQIIDTTLRQQSFTPKDTLYLGLHETNPTGAGLITTEVSGYERQPIIFSSGDAGATLNTNEVLFENMPACTVEYVAIWDELTGGNMYFYGDVDTINVDSNDDVSIDVGTITWEFTTESA